MDPMQAIRETFFQECEEQLGELETGLLAMESGDGRHRNRQRRVPRRPFDQGRRRRVQARPLVRFAHVFETTLDKIRSGQLAASPPVMKSCCAPPTCSPTW